MQAILHRRRASKKQLQSLAGKLSWACRVVYGARTFLRQILHVMCALRSSATWYRLSPELYADLPWCSEFLMIFSGKQLLLDSSLVADVQTDACYEGMGAFFSGDWPYVHFAFSLPVMKDLHI